MVSFLSFQTWLHTCKIYLILQVVSKQGNLWVEFQIFEFSWVHQVHRVFRSLFLIFSRFLPHLQLVCFLILKLLFKNSLWFEFVFSLIDLIHCSKFDWNHVNKYSHVVSFKLPCSIGSNTRIPILFPDYYRCGCCILKITSLESRSMWHPIIFRTN